MSFSSQRTLSPTRWSTTYSSSFQSPRSLQSRRQQQQQQQQPIQPIQHHHVMRPSDFQSDVQLPALRERTIVNDRQPTRSLSSLLASSLASSSSPSSLSTRTTTTTIKTKTMKTSTSTTTTLAAPPPNLSSTCVICCDEKATEQTTCGHCCMCLLCFTQLCESRYNRCPLCRAAFL